MRAAKISGIIFLIFLLAGFLSYQNESTFFVSPFFLNEMGLIIWGISVALMHRMWIGIFVALLFSLGSFQNIYWLQFIQFDIDYSMVIFLNKLFSIVIVALVLILLVRTLFDFKKFKKIEVITWSIFALLYLLLLFFLSQEMEHLTITFMVLNVFLLIFNLNLKAQPPYYFLFWEAWLLFSALEVLKVWSLVL